MLVRMLVILGIAVLLAGCAVSSREEAAVIPPAPSEGRGADLGLGPGVRPLSAGPGNKSSPSWSPDGERIAYVLDGYVVDKPLFTQDYRRRTARDLGAEEVHWTSGHTLTILAPDQTADTPLSEPLAEVPEIKTRSVYQTSSEGEIEIDRITDRVLAMTPLPPGGYTLASVIDAALENRLAIISSGEELGRLPLTGIEGRVTALSASPDGRQVILAAQDVPGNGPVRLYLLDFPAGTPRLLTQLPPELRLLGDPQWTTHGIYYIAGEERDSDAAAYSLYRLPPNSPAPESVAAVGRDFVPASVKAAPDGERLAIVGRRNPASPTNLYVLNPGSGRIEAVTSNENMDIKISPTDLAWSPDGRHIAIVARSASTAPAVYDTQASSLIRDFYNIYRVPAP
ncbi:hypothetical protein E0L93_13385 [Rubrobacter taiwanensis]|uniref:Lipoprotein LpqB beta-propeller domain-containing protein n=1 Tax=Rubrobacter taiwanensis TaxID=185139 RepID=A0A4V2NVW7_9ACTN|nr:PD40 domain-containing protein [Rubrobacter taiwanensis]TCJ15142.1 hypothetical protein E0L93_13385 [Rubrobacter taiwanensis]